MPVFGSTRLNQPLKRPVHTGLKINDILPKLTNVCYMAKIDANLGNHNLKPDKKLSYLTKFAYQFGNGKHHSAQPIELEVLKCLVSKGHFYFSSLSGDLCQGNNDCAFALYFNYNCVIKICC